MTIGVGDTEGYTVRLEAFEGPLDLLLFLIRRAEVDIHDIPISPIADQFIAHLEHTDRVDVDTAGEFLVMAATLMEIKSRMIDRESGGDDQDGTASQHQAHASDNDQSRDPRRELVEQLLEYKKYRQAADQLESRRETWAKHTPARPIGVHGDEFRAALESVGEAALEDLSLIDLVHAFRRIADSVNFEALGEHEVLSDDTPIEIHAEDIVQMLKEHAGTHQRGGQLPLFSVLQGRTRAEMVGLFLALLSLIRDERVAFHQPQTESSSESGSQEGDRPQIVLELREPPNEQPVAEPPGEPPGEPDDEPDDEPDPSPR
mgnify:CR=1 FL=1